MATALNAWKSGTAPHSETSGRRPRPSLNSSYQCMRGFHQCRWAWRRPSSASERYCPRRAARVAASGSGTWPMAASDGAATRSAPATARGTMTERRSMLARATVAAAHERRGRHRPARSAPARGWTGSCGLAGAAPNRRVRCPGRPRRRRSGHRHRGGRARIVPRAVRAAPLPRVDGRPVRRAGAREDDRGAVRPPAARHVRGLRRGGGVRARAAPAGHHRGDRGRGLDPVRATMLFGLNPIVLVYAIGGAHNDLLMLALAMLAVALVLRGRERGGGGSLVASAAIKASAIALLPFMVLGSARPRRVLLGAAIGAVVFAAIAVAGFGSHALTFVADIGKQQGLVSGNSVPSEVAQLFGAARVTPGMRLAGQVLLVAAVAYLLWRTWKGDDWLTAAGWALLVVSVTTTWLLAWYTLWALPFAAISRQWRLLAATLLLQALFLAHGITPLVA